MESVAAPLSQGVSAMRRWLSGKRRATLMKGGMGYQGGNLTAHLGRRRPGECVWVNCTRCGYGDSTGHAELVASLVGTATSGLRRIVEWGCVSISRENFALIPAAPGQP